MDGDERSGGVIRWDDLSAVAHDFGGAAESELRGGGAEADQQVGLNEREFRFGPRAAGGDFAGAGLGVDATLATGLPFEVFYGVGDVADVAVDAGFFEGAIEHPSRGTNKGTAFAIFGITGLLSDQHDARILGSFSEDGLSAGQMEWAGGALFRSRPQFL